MVISFYFRLIVNCRNNDTADLHWDFEPKPTDNERPFMFNQHELPEAWMH